MASPPAAFLLGQLSLVQLFVVAVVQGLAGVVSATSEVAFFAHLVPRSRYVEAHSLTATPARRHSSPVPPLAALVQALTHRWPWWSTPSRPSRPRPLCTDRS